MLPLLGPPRWYRGKESVYQCRRAGDESLIPGSGRFPGVGNSNPLQDSCLGNPMDGPGISWWATVYGPGGLQSMRSQSV